MAKEILNEYWDKNLPVDILSIARDMGLVVYSLCNSDIDSGFVGRVDGNDIYIDIQQLAVEQRFILAFCIAKHKFGDRDITIDSNYKSSMYIGDLRAINFALELLLPKNYVRHFVISLGYTSVKDMASNFSVSYEIMRRRLVNLNLI